MSGPTAKCPDCTSTGVSDSNALSLRVTRTISFIPSGRLQLPSMVGRRSPSTAVVNSTCVAGHAGEAINRDTIAHHRRKVLSASMIDPRALVGYRLTPAFFRCAFPLFDALSRHTEQAQRASCRNDAHNCAEL